jgi:hypothetical protein
MQEPTVLATRRGFSHGWGSQTAWIGVLIGALALGIGAWYYFGSHEEWQTMVFTSKAENNSQHLRVRLLPITTSLSGALVGVVTLDHPLTQHWLWCVSIGVPLR